MTERSVTVSLVQPTSKTCGQTCVAMLTGAGVDDVCRLAGTVGPTFGSHLVRALRALGAECPSRPVPVRQVRGFVPEGIARVAPGPGAPGHWVVWADGYFTDPANGMTWRPEDFTCIYEARGWRVTSILPVARQSLAARPDVSAAPLLRGMTDQFATYYANEGTPLPCGCSCLFARVLDADGQEIDRVSVAHPREGILLRYALVDGELTTRDEHRAFELHCMRHPDTVVRSAQPRGLMTLTDQEGREVGGPVTSPAVTPGTRQ